MQCSAGVVAQDAASPSAPLSPVSFRWNVEVIGAVRGLVPATTVINPGNRALRLPETTWMGDLRGNFRLEAGSRLSVVLRPRVNGDIQRVAPDDVGADTTRNGHAQLAEAFVTWRPADTLAVTYGLQNFQWGPAELLSPSNRVFHETGLFRDPLYSVRGRHLLRANVSLGRQWSLVALADLSHNGAGADEAFRAGAPFRRQGLLKVEWSAPGGGSYAGVTGGVVEAARPWFGEYGTWMLSDAIALYVDASHARGSAAWYPARVHPATSPGFVQRPHRDDWQTMAVAGLRYTFVRGDELRVEYVHQDAGYARDELRNAPAMLLLVPTRAQFERFAAPGLEFLGRDLALVSLRSPDLPPGKRVNLQLRYLRSFTDDSGVGFGNVTVNITGAMVGFATVALTHGPDWAEFSRVARGSFTAGVVYSF